MKKTNFGPMLVSLTNAIVCNGRSRTFIVGLLPFCMSFDNVLMIREKLQSVEKT